MPQSLVHTKAGGAPTSSPVIVDKALPSLDDTDGVLLLNQHGELGGHLKYVFTLQDDVPLWRGVTSDWKVGGSAGRGAGRGREGRRREGKGGKGGEGTCWGWGRRWRPEAVVTYLLLFVCWPNVNDQDSIAQAAGRDP